MANIIEFKMPYWEMVGDTEYIYTGRVKTFGKTLAGAKGPSDYEGYAYFSDSVITVPHLDKFNTISNIYTGKSGVNITLSGETKTYNMPVYEYTNDTLDQYFLENKTRDGIQYLLNVQRDSNGNISEFNAFVPGLLISSTGKVLGFLKSHVPESGKIEITLPFGTDPYSYGVDIVSGSVGSIDKSQQNKIVITGVYSNIQVRLVYGSENVYFNVYTSSNDVRPFEVKIVNQFGDYLVASGKSNMKDVLDSLSGLEQKQITTFRKNGSSIEQITVTKKFPVTFMSLLSNTPSEEVKNITPNIYKVPAAFVGTDKTFMTDVTGLSYNGVE